MTRWVRFGHDGMSALSPFYPQLRTFVLIREVAIGLPHLMPERYGSAYAASGPSGGAAQVMLLWAASSFGRRCSRYIRSTCSRVRVFAKRSRKAVISCG